MTTRDNLLRLDVGCGHTMKDGYLRMDANPAAPQLDYVGEMDKLPFDDNFLHEIRVSHVIEHVHPAKAREVLREFYRALQPGGFAWLDTPNIERNISRYLGLPYNGNQQTWMDDFRKLTPSEQEYCSLNGVPNKTLWVNFKIFSSHHQWDVHFANYDAELLQAFCKEAGFDRTEVLQTEPSLILRAFK